MAMCTLSLTTALIVTAIPLSAGAAPAQANHQLAANVEQATPATEACPDGWVWEPPGNTSSGHWRPAHCAPRNAAVP